MAKVMDAVKAEYLDYMKNDRHENEKWISYYDSSYQRVVKTDDEKFVKIDKPRINTSFCFGESGYDMDDAIAACRRADSDQDYFRSENLRDLDRRINLLKNGNVWIVFGQYRDSREVSLFFSEKYCGPGIWYRDDEIREVSDGERARLLEAYEDVRASFVKRIDSYLKRYGLSKVRSWTYWRDA